MIRVFDCTLKRWSGHPPELGNPQPHRSKHHESLVTPVSPKAAFGIACTVAKILALSLTHDARTFGDCRLKNIVCYALPPEAVCTP